MIDFFHAGLLLIFAGIFLPIIPNYLRASYLLIVPVSALVMIWSSGHTADLTFSFMGFDTLSLRNDSLSRLFATVFALVTLVGNLYCCKQTRVLELSSALIYAGSAISVIYAGDLISLFIFWEIMALTSTLIIWSNIDNKHAQDAGFRYLYIHILGGVVLLCGIVLKIHDQGSIDFSKMHLGELSSILIFTGFLINVAAPPFSAWLSDAYPESSFSGMVFLSAFTTKTAVYVLMRGFPGTEILIPIGLYMVFYGIIYALLENDMRRILAYSIVNQVGFMVAAIGIGTEIALNGAAAHAFCHIIYKALLLMSAGAVLYQTGKRKCTDLGGLIHTMPLTATCGIIGALAISSFPLTSGFVSKSMIVEASANQHFFYTWLLLEIASAGVFLHAGIKFPWFVFFQKDSGLRPAEPPINMLMAMIIFSAICIVIGCFPATFYSLLPYSVEYHPYQSSKVITQLQLLLFSGLAFFILLPWMKRTLTISLDLDWFYRRYTDKLLSGSYFIIEAIAYRSENLGKISIKFVNNTRVFGAKFFESSISFSLLVFLCLFLLALATSVVFI